MDGPLMISSACKYAGVRPKAEGQRPSAQFFLEKLLRRDDEVGANKRLRAEGGLLPSADQNRGTNPNTGRISVQNQD